MFLAEIAAMNARPDDRTPEQKQEARPDDLTPAPADEAWQAALPTGKTLPNRPPAAGSPGIAPPELAGLRGYEIVRELGRGGMGVVYLARNTVMDRPEVLKVMNQNLVGRPDAVDRFLQEIRSAARLIHPNIATAFSAHPLDDLLILAMEYVQGDDLSKVVRTRGPLPITHACYYIYQAAQGLQCAHELGLVHRDIKPGNLILARIGKRTAVKIVDFGLAKAKTEVPSERDLTGTNQMMGTPGYTAPEQLHDAKTADIRADIYSLGCTLYCLLTGGGPFKGENPVAVLFAQQAGKMTVLREARSDVPEGLAKVVARMMASDPHDRYRQPAEVAAALIPFVKQGAKSVPDAPAEVRRQPGQEHTLTPDGTRIRESRLPEKESFAGNATPARDTVKATGVEGHAGYPDRSSELVSSTVLRRSWLVELRRRPGLQALILTLLLFGGVILAVIVASFVPSSQNTRTPDSQNDRTAASQSNRTASSQDNQTPEPQKNRTPDKAPAPIPKSNHRWSITFSESADGLFDQLHQIGAVLAIPKGAAGNGFWVVHDLKARPVQLFDEDIAKFKGERFSHADSKYIDWIVKRFGLQYRPSTFSVFLPQEFEDKLIQEELRLRRASGSQNDPQLYTIFELKNVDGKLMPEAVRQQK
jgi:serine/threonine protein kinase